MARPADCVRWPRRCAAKHRRRVAGSPAPAPLLDARRPPVPRSPTPEFDFAASLLDLPSPPGGLLLDPPPRSPTFAPDSPSAFVATTPPSAGADELTLATPPPPAARARAPLPEPLPRDAAARPAASGWASQPTPTVAERTAQGWGAMMQRANELVGAPPRPPSHAPSRQPPSRQPDRSPSWPANRQPGWQPEPRVDQFVHPERALPGGPMRSPPRRRTPPRGDSHRRYSHASGPARPLRPEPRRRDVAPLGGNGNARRRGGGRASAPTDLPSSAWTERGFHPPVPIGEEWLHYDWALHNCIPPIPMARVTDFDWNRYGFDPPRPFQPQRYPTDA